MRMHSYSTFPCDRFDHCDNLEITGSSMVNSFQGIGFFLFFNYYSSVFANFHGYERGHLEQQLHLVQNS